MRRDVVATLAAMNMETVPPFPASSHSPIVYLLLSSQPRQIQTRHFSLPI